MLYFFYRMQFFYYGLRWTQPNTDIFHHGRKTKAMTAKKFSLLLIIITLAGTIHAQVIDRVVLKNGSIVKGNVAEMVPDVKVVINDMAGNTWVYSMNEVERIEQTVSDQPYGTFEAFKPGFVNMTTVGFLVGSQASNYIAPFSFQTSLGMNYGPGIYTGLATGLEFINIVHIPLMLDMQYFLKSGDVAPVVIMRAGYTFPSTGSSHMYSTTLDYSGGVTGSLGLGLKIRNRDFVAWDISVLYRYMQINYNETYDYNNTNYTYKDVYNRLELRLGFYLGN